MILIDVKADQVDEEHKAEEERKEGGSFHDLERSWVVRTIVKDRSKVDFELKKSIGIPSHAPHVENEESYSSKHWKNECHWVNVFIILFVKIHDVEKKY